MIKRFIVYGTIGVGAEILWTGLGTLIRGDLSMAGHSSIWMFPIYGMMVFLEKIHDNTRHMPVIIRGGVYTLLIYTGEFISGTFLKLIGACPWNYEQLPFSIYGVITFSYIPVWFILGLFFEILHDFLIQNKIGYNRI